MAPRANWKGFLRLSLVTCPVALYPATSDSEKISFNQINKETPATASNTWWTPTPARGLHSRKYDDEVQLYAFDILALEGVICASCPCTFARTISRGCWRGGQRGYSLASSNRARPDLFRQACKFGLEGLVSKRRESVYRGGRSPNRIKVKNRSHPAMERAKEAFA